MKFFFMDLFGVTAEQAQQLWVIIFLILGSMTAIWLAANLVSFCIRKTRILQVLHSHGEWLNGMVKTFFEGLSQTISSMNRGGERANKVRVISWKYGCFTIRTNPGEDLTKMVEALQRAMGFAEEQPQEKDEE